MATLMEKTLRGLKNLLKRIHYSIPAKVRNIYWPVFHSCQRWFRKHLDAIFPSMVLYEGHEPNSQEPLSFVYSGDIHEMHNYFDHFMLNDGFTKRALGRRFFWRVIPEIKRDFPSCGFLIMEQSTLTIPFLQGKPGFPIPVWVTTEIDIGPAMPELFARQRSDIERLIRKNRLSVEMTKDPQCFKDFYYNMFVPYVTQRYTDTAMIVSYEGFLKTVPTSEMLLIKKDDKTIAGAVVEFRDRKPPMLCRLGIVDSNLEYVRFGAIGAIYYFLVQELKKRGYNLVDTGNTRPLLSDGLTRYKQALGARPCQKNFQQHSCIKFMVLQNSEGVRGFLTHNPFLFKDGKKQLCLALFVEDKGELMTKALNAALTSSFCSGCEETRMYVFGDRNLPEDRVCSNGRPICFESAEELIREFRS